MKKNSALANLGWPFSMMEQEGVLSWSIREFEPEERFGNAIVSYRDNSITAIASLRDGSGAVVSDVELGWTVSGGTASEASSKMAGAPCDFWRAVEAFQVVISKADEPLFSPAAQASSAQAARSGAL